MILKFVFDFQINLKEIQSLLQKILLEKKQNEKGKQK